MEIDHGQEVINGTYGYIIACDGQIPTRLPQVLSNDTLLQAAQSADEKKLGAVFYHHSKKVESTIGSFQVSHPVALFVEYKEKEISITVTDARMDHELNEIIVITSLPVKGENVIAEENGLYRIVISLPTEPNRGALVTCVYQIDK